MRCFIVLLLLAGTAHADLEADARKVLDGQLKTIRTGDEAAFRALFDPDAIVVGYKPDEPGKELSDLYFVADLFGGSPHTSLRKLAVKSIGGVGGDAKAMWFTAEITASAHIPEPGFGASNETITFRLSELATFDGKAWKIVAAAVDLPSTPRGSAGSEFTGATVAGPLTAMLAAPATTAAALRADAFVIGTDKAERGIGPAAKKLLAKWSKLELAIEGKPREVRTATWGFAQAHVAWKQKTKTVYMSALVIAVPKPDGTWTPVGLHYSGE